MQARIPQATEANAAGHSHRLLGSNGGPAKGHAPFALSVLDEAAQAARKLEISATRSSIDPRLRAQATSFRPTGAASRGRRGERRFCVPIRRTGSNIGRNASGRHLRGGLGRFRSGDLEARRPVPHPIDSPQLPPHVHPDLLLERAVDVPSSRWPPGGPHFFYWNPQ